ncbi:MAG: hypothetical protein AM326_12360 [Candidatus Thorarchaeota archaeon SMTZ-45]|nr:MAG: hypothetical protein AM326_12360 [Candidatus Thorarchaeota archaeon SMTZ-45]KXH75218.1 MAG: hypothetical protein AM325_04545 [Candidatus Thorarchaeota archaeon SMTZ1-45]
MPDEIYDYWMVVAKDLAVRFNIDQFDTSSAMWSWDNFSEDIQSLRSRLGLGDMNAEILGLRLDFETGEVYDVLVDKPSHSSRLIPYLFYYSKAKDEGISGEWVKFNTLRGSWACRYSFDEEDVGKLITVFNENQDAMFAAIEKLGGKRVDFGNAAFEVSFLPYVKVLLIFEEADEEFPADVRLLYDSNSVFYLPHELLGTISWFLAERVMKAI